MNDQAIFATLTQLSKKDIQRLLNDMTNVYSLLISNVQKMLPHFISLEKNW